MSHMKLSKALAAVDTFLFNLWTKHKDVMLGHGARVDANGKPYVIVFTTKPINGELPAWENDTPVRIEVLMDADMPVPARSAAKKINAFICQDCNYEFAIVDLTANEDPNWQEGDPACPKCGDSDHVSKIRCVNLTLAETGTHLELGKSVNPLPK